MALRVVQNGLITLEDCKYPKRTACKMIPPSAIRSLLRMTALRCMGGCRLPDGSFENALLYASSEQFGKPIASFQLIQDLLVKMVATSRPVSAW